MQLRFHACSHTHASDRFPYIRPYTPPLTRPDSFPDTRYIFPYIFSHSTGRCPDFVTVWKLYENAVSWDLHQQWDQQRLCEPLYEGSRSYCMRAQGRS